MGFLFSTGSLWSYSIERVFSFAEAAGFDGLELLVDMRWETRQAPYLQQLIDRYHLPVLAIHSPFLPNVPGWPNGQPERIRCSVELATQLGAAVVVHHLPSRFGSIWIQMPGRFFPIPFPRNQDNDYRHWLENQYHHFQATTPIKLCIENMPAFLRFGRRWNLWRWNTIQEIIRFPKLTLDTTHLGTWGLEPVEVYPQLADKVGHIHLSNFDKEEHLRPETGKLHLDKLLKHLAETKYNGDITLELQPDVLDAGKADGHIIERMATSLNHCRSWLS